MRKRYIALGKPIVRIEGYLSENFIFESVTELKILRRQKDPVHELLGSNERLAMKAII